MALTIKLEDVSHGFTLVDKQQITLFEALNTTITSSRIYAILGASGTGKSTLLSLMAGLEKPNTGQISFFHEEHNLLSLDDYRQRCGFIFQQFHLLPEFDAQHNVALPLQLRGDKQAFAKAAHWLQKVGLGERMSQPVSLLSGGEQQRVAIARAFVSEPEIIFADEPTGNLDENTATQITELMLSCCKENQCGLVLVTHNHELAERANHCFRLSQGRLEQLK